MTKVDQQKLIIITGSPYVGKTAVATKLFESYENSAYCDGDWMWHVNPFSRNDPRLRNGDKNMAYVLSTYLNSNFDYVVFSSVDVMDKTVRENILQEIRAKDYMTIGFTLTCSEETLTQRHRMRGDETEVSFEWLYMNPYFSDYVIKTDNKDVQQIVDEMKEIIDAQMHTQLFTDDLILRTVTEGDIEEVARMWEYPEEITIEDARRALANMTDQHKKNRPGAIGHLRLGVFRKESPKRLIGWCSLDGESDPEKTALTYVIDKKFGGRGYATQCAVELLRYAFTDMGYHIIYGSCEKDNWASYRVMQKAGMSQNAFNEKGNFVFSIDKETFLRVSRNADQGYGRERMI